jgi:glycosyltransferase involved in cell wall biosynthesis
MEMIKIIFLVRNDFFMKFGGDTFQINQYIENINGIDFSIVTLNDFNENLTADLYIITNTDRCFEFVEFSVLLRKFDLFDKVAILPIHHSLKAIEEFNFFKYGKAWKLLKIFGGFFFLEKIKGFYRNIKEGKLLSSLSHFNLNYKLIIRKALIDCRFVISIAQGEVVKIKEDFNISQLENYYIIRNGVSDSFISKIYDNEYLYSDRDIDVLVCGRIEERKNQLSIVKALTGINANIVFIGALNENNKSYATQFIRSINSECSMAYQGSVNPEDIANYYKRTKICLSASWFEVSSLVDIEAYYSGCLVFSSLNGHSSEIIPESHIDLVDPSNLKHLKGHIENKLSSLENCNHSNNNDRSSLSWAKAADELNEVFKSEVTNIYR